MRENARFKIGHARIKMVFGHPESKGRQRVGAFKWPDSHESFDSRELPEGFRTEPPLLCESRFGALKHVRKIRAPTKIKSALPPPKTQNTPPPKKIEEFYGHGFFLQKQRIFSRRP